MSRHTPKKMPKARNASRPVAAGGTPPGDAFGQALAAYREGRFDDAEAILRGVLKQTPTDAGCWNNLGNLLQESGRLGDAEAAFAQAIALNPELPDFRANLGNLLKLARRLPEAEAAYRKAVELGPDNPASHNQLGLLLKEAGKLAAAEAAFHHCLALNPGFADAHNNLGILQKEAGRLAEAEASYRRARELNPEFAEPNNNLGILLFEDGRFDEAEAIFRRALQLRPDLANAYSNLGNLLRKTKRLAEAEAAYRSALELEPDFADAHNNLGILLKEADQLAEAEVAYRRAIELNPGYAEAHDNLGALLLDDGRLPEAEAELRRAIALKPEFADAHSNLGNLLKQTRHLVEAEGSYRHAIDLKPDVAGVHNNLAILLSQTARLDEAEQEFLRAVELQPDFVEAHNNYGNLLKEMGRLTEAEAAYRRALELKPNSVDARLNLALLLLALGRYDEAWTWHEARHVPDSKARRAMQPPFGFPQWKGEPLAGKSLVVVLEQGAGDNFQFVRYAPLLKARGLARLSFYQPGPFIPLQATAQGIDFISSDPAAVEPHDYWVFPLSLPFHLGTTLDTIPDTLPYLWALPERIEKWRPRLPTSGFKVGLVWKGNPDHQNDANRSLPHLSSLAPLWAVPGVSFVSLQKGQGEDEARQPPPGQPLLQVGDDIADFGDTAAIIAQLDLLITIDSAAAHVAGALGKPVWVLLPGFGTDWRWLLEREDSPWYPDVMRLFRQPREAKSWDATIAEVASALRDRVGNQPAALAPTAASDSVRPLRPVVLIDEPPAPVVVRADAPGAAPIDAAGQALAAYQAGRGSDAEAILREALERDASDAGCWNNLGNLLQETGRLADGEAAFGRAIALAAGQPEFHGNLGNLLKLARRLPEAEAAYRRAIECAPGNAACHNQLGMLLGLADRLPEAEAAYRRALELDPGLADAHNNLGILLKAEGKLADAETTLRRAVELSPSFAEAHNNLGIALFEDDRLADAEPCFRRALELKPDFSDAHSNLGNLLKKAKRLPEAELAYHRALELNPTDAKAHNNLGVLLHEAERFVEGEAAYRKSLALDPDFAEAHCNLGILMQRFGRHAEAEAAYRRALELNPRHTDSRLNLGMLLLLLGRYAEAWPYHEARYFPDTRERRAMHPTLPYPQWQGEPLAGKSLVVGTEQGYGDNIQFLRYVPLLKALGLTRLTLVQTRALVPLIATVDDTVAVVSDVADMPVHDYWCFALSLPLHLGTTLDTIPATIPYLHVLPERAARWHQRLPAGGFKIGLVWKGNVDHKNDFRRSLPGLATLAPLWEIPGITFISLQKGQGEDEARQPPLGQPLLHVGDDIADFADTAAIIAELDLLISIDSAAAHVAGALGKPVWVLLPGVGTDWRWLLERSDSPWYPGAMRLFRQPLDAASWDETIQEVTRALRRQLGATSGMVMPDALRAPDGITAEALLLQAQAAYVGGRREEAGQLLRRMLAADPRDASAWNNLGVLLLEDKRFPETAAESEAALRKAIELNPDSAEARTNLGNCLRETGRLAQAEIEYRRVLEMDGDKHAARLNLAQLLLYQGRFADGWAYNEAALTQNPGMRQPPDFGIPQWQGEALAGKSLVVVHEQGHGDNIQLVRYASLLGDMGLTRLTFTQTAPRIPLLATQHGIDVVTPDAVVRGSHDYWCYLFSVPFHLGTTLETIPATLPYLAALPERIQRWRPRLPPSVKVGLVWKGNPDHKNDARRSLPDLSVLAPLWEIPGVSYLSLQMGQGADEARPAPPGQPLLHLGDDIADFGDTAAIVAQLDLLITIDSALAHLAGALAIPVWVLLPGYGSDWRWLAEREDSPWYPGVMRLFRQRRGATSWQSTIRDVASALRERIAALPDRPPPDAAQLAPTLDAAGADALLQQAHAAFVGGRRDEAEARLRELLTGDPAHTAALNNLAGILAESGRRVEAEAAYRRAIELNPGYADFHVNFARFLMSAGRLAEAEDAYRAALALNPAQPGILGALAQMLKEAGRTPEAEELFDQALALDPTYGAAHNNRGILLLDTGRAALAEDSFRRAIALDTNFAEGWTNLGNALKAQQRHAEAEAALRMAAALRPTDIQLLHNLAVFLDGTQREAEAEVILRRITGLAPDDQAVWNKLGMTLQKQQRWVEAEEAFRQAVALKPEFVSALGSLGSVLQAQHHFAEARDAFRRALAIEPDNPSILSQLAQLLKETRRPAEAERAYRRILELNPRDIIAHNNFGNLLLDGKRLAEAEASFRQALDIDPSFEATHSHLGNVLKARNRPVEAEVAYRRALEISPDSVGAKLNLGFLLFALGRYAEAWPYHEERFYRDKKDRQPPNPGLPWPQWQGEPLAGKSLVVFAEQGHGDNIQFVRYAPLLKAAGATTLSLIQPASLIPLLATAHGVDAVVADAASLPPHDYWVFPLSLPFHFDTTVDTIPNGLPYLWALPERIEKWRPRLLTEGIKIGLVWKGNPDHDNDANRSLPHLSALAQLWEVPGISFISLQKGRGEDEARQAPATQPLLHLGDDIGDFADTAAIIAQLDLVITIDSAAAHLAGALGKPVWLLLPGFCTDWRWLLQREDSPWYPGVMRLFRQPYDETTWDNTIDRVAAALLEWSASAPALTLPRREDSPAPPMTIPPTLRPLSPTTDGRDTVTGVAEVVEFLTPAEEEAECRALIAQMPDSAPHHFHLGTLLQARDTRPDEAEAAYRNTLRIDPEFAGASWNLALLLLAQGRWLDAWPYFDRRSDPFRPGFTAQYPCPEWRGENLAGKSLVIDSCESLGDNIMCARYVPLLKAAGARSVTLRHRASLKTLLETVAGVDAVVTDPRALVAHDFWCFSFSLPIRFGTMPETIPASLPYVRTLDARLTYWRRRLAPLTGFRVGLVWKGDPNLDTDRERSLAGLAALAPLWEVPGVSFVSLQKGQGENEGIAPPPDQPLLHLGSDIDDFADSAAIVAQLDLLISVDTAAAHVAGALGRPVWLLLPGNSEWRWLRDRADTPWYPGVMRLFRQPRQAATWESVIREVATALAARACGETELIPPPVAALPEPPTTAGQSEEFLLPLPRGRSGGGWGRNGHSASVPPSVDPIPTPAPQSQTSHATFPVTGRELAVPPVALPETAVSPIITEPALETSMKRPALRPVAFVLASSDHGTLIVNRNDHAGQGGSSFGVGYQVLSNSSFDAAEVDLALQMLEFRRKLFGDGVMALDCGANIGVHTVEWARLMHGWGSVIAVEAQERVFYALAGNLSINNCFNARALWGAIGAENGEIVVPRPNYLQPGSFGSLEIRPSARNEFIGQAIDYSEQAGLRTRLFTIDSLALPRLDFIKIDIEGMEMEALAGAVNSIRKFHPQMIIEKIKSDENALRNWLVAEGYRLGSYGLNLVAVHGSDPSNTQLIV